MQLVSWQVQNELSMQLKFCVLRAREGVVKFVRWLTSLQSETMISLACWSCWHPFRIDRPKPMLWFWGLGKMLEKKYSMFFGYVIQSFLHLHRCWLDDHALAWFLFNSAFSNFPFTCYVVFFSSSHLLNSLAIQFIFSKSYMWWTEPWKL